MVHSILGGVLMPLRYDLMSNVFSLGLSRSDNAGATPLMLAVEANSPSCIKWLLERGADPKLHLKTGWQALHLALRLGHDSCVLMLLQEVRLCTLRALLVTG